MLLNQEYYTRGKVDSLLYFAPGFYRSHHDTSAVWRDFNPNKTRNRVRGTTIEMHTNNTMNCLAHLMNAVRILASEYNMSTLPLVDRIDFCVDCNTKDGFYKEWVKMAEWAIYCFSAKKNVTPGRIHRDECGITGAHTATSSRTDGWEFVIYNKELQRKSAGVGYRFEIRHKHIKNEDERKALEKMIALVRSLPPMAEKSMEIMNAKLLNKWHATAPCKNTPRDVNEFIRAHMDEIFCREQLKRLYIAIGYEQSAEKQAASKAVRNFLNRNSEIYLVDEKDLTAFCECIALHIENYIKGTTAA